MNKRDLTRDLVAVGMALMGLALAIWGIVELGWGMLLWTIGMCLFTTAGWLAAREPRPPAAPDGLAPDDDGNRLELRPARGSDTT